MAEDRKWDAVVIITHWIVAFAAISLFFTGISFELVEELLGKDAERLLSVFHYYLGLVMILGASIRIAWGFVGDESVRWSRLLKEAPNYPKWLRAEIDFLLFGANPHDRKKAGHNPLAIPVYLAALAMFVIQAYTGLVMWEHFKKESAAKGFAHVTVWPKEASAESFTYINDDDSHWDAEVFVKGGDKEAEDEDFYEDIHEFGLVWVPLFLIIHLGGMFAHRLRGDRNVFSPMIPRWPPSSD